MTTLHTISPTGLRGGPTLLLLHGFGANEQDLFGLISPLDVPPNWDILSIRAPLPVPQMTGAAWFPFDAKTKRGHISEELDALDDEAIAKSLELLLATLDEKLPKGKIVPIGFSQGAVMAAELMRARPERVPAAVLLSGFVLPTEKSSVESDQRLTELDRPVFFGWGEQDDSSISRAAFKLTEEWLRTHTRATIHRYPELGHEVSMEELRDVRGFLEGIHVR
jgi:phospholipase/carboxylesterase